MIRVTGLIISIGSHSQNISGVPRHNHDTLDTTTGSFKSANFGCTLLSESESVISIQSSHLLGGRLLIMSLLNSGTDLMA